MNDVEMRLASLAGVAQELNRASDEVTTFLRDVETRLAEMKLGVDVLADKPFHSDEAGAIGNLDDATQLFEVTQYVLGYAKIGASWRITVTPIDCLFVGEDESCVDCGQEIEDRRTVLEPRPLLDMSREIRLAAASGLGGLLAQIESAARERVQAIRTAIVTARASAEGAGTVAAESRAPGTGSSAMRQSRKRTSKQIRPRA